MDGVVAPAAWDGWAGYHFQHRAKVCVVYVVPDPREGDNTVPVNHHESRDSPNPIASGSQKKLITQMNERQGIGPEPPPC